MQDFLIARGWVPDFMIRGSIRKRLSQTIHEESKKGQTHGPNRILDFVDELKRAPIAVSTQEESKKPLEMPPRFFETILGRGMKYSSGYWREGVVNLDLSESDMLETTLWRAEIVDGHNILELGCGWGSLSLLAAFRFPNSRVTAVSNSSLQKSYIEQKAAERGITNLTVITADMNQFETDEKYDRVVSIEMFEHMRNYEKLLDKISSWLTPEGKLFVHLFCHHKYAYLYESSNRRDWIARYFFKGGIMPSENLLLYFDNKFQIENRWKIPGTHYQKTCRAWLERMDKNKDGILQIFREVYGAKDAKRWMSRWRVFFMSCEELFGYKNGEEWYVTHYLLKKKTPQESSLHNLNQ
jgi:cyclopropane-fatty-acyl-phospholipid synthase